MCIDLTVLIKLTRRRTSTLDCKLLGVLQSGQERLRSSATPMQAGQQLA